MASDSNTLQLTVLRYNSAKDYTDGLFFINDKFECYTLEDEDRTIKKFGETRIPDGTYRITLRTIGGFHKRYTKKFGSFHHGMLWVRDVPEFEYILIHIGNTDDDTAGCLLVGTSSDAYKGFIGGSTGAYKKMYPKIANHLLEGGEVTIKYQTIGE